MLTLPSFKDIEGFSDYQIATSGIIYKKSTNEQIKKKFYIHLINDHGKTIFIHIYRLLAKVYIPNPLNKPFIHFIDGNKYNKCINNLEWIDYGFDGCIKTMSIYDNSGIIGVCLITDKFGKKYIRSHIRKDNKMYQKNFSFSDQGFKDAKVWRLKTEFNLRIIV